MKKFTAIALAFSFLSFSALKADNGFQKEFSIQSLANLDDIFTEMYQDNNKLIGRAVYPLLVVDGFIYTLYLSPGKTETFNGDRLPFEQLKAVSHVGPALYTIGLIAANEPNSPTWNDLLKNYSNKLQAALIEVDQVDWSDEAWPGKQNQLKRFMKDSLQMAYAFTQYILKKGTYTKEDYQEFAGHYLHTMLNTMYLADLGNTTHALDQLERWKKTLGPEKWKDLYAVVIGNKGRSSAGLTIDTNTAAYTIASLMDKDQVSSHLFIFPDANSQEEILSALGAIRNAAALARSTFTSENIKNAKTAPGIEAGLNDPTTPLAMSNVKNIVHKSIINEKEFFPDLTMLKKDSDYIKKLSAK